MIDEWRSIMDNLSDAYYLILLITVQIYIFFRNFIFREFTWYAPAEENFEDDANSKIPNATPQHTTVDFLMLFATCGLVFAFMILSTKSPKDKTLNYTTVNNETMPMVYGEKPSFRFSRSTNSEFVNHLPECSEPIDSRDVIPKIQNIPCPAISKGRVSPRSRASSYSMRFSSQHSGSKQSGRRELQPQKEWLLRHTRSGQIYGKYPI